MDMIDPLGTGYACNAEKFLSEDERAVNRENKKEAVLKTAPPV